MRLTRSLLLLVAVALASAVILIASRGGRDEAAQIRVRITEAVLDPVDRLLKRNEVLVDELRSEPYAEPDAGMVRAYLAKIRRDGLPKHAAMKAKLEELADNQLKVVTLLEAYLPIAQTPGLAAAAAQFRDASTTWRERWKTTMELFMAGGHLIEAEIPTHADLLPAVRSERASAMQSAR